MTKTSAKAFSEVAAADLATFGEQKKGLDKVQEFLTRFGYLQPRNFKSGQLDSITSVALQKYQEYNGLLTTGEFDSATRAQMTTHRCGHSDLQDGVGFVTRCAWDRRDLTYAFDSGTNDVAGQAEFQAVRNAFQTWAAAVPITFTEVDINANPDILIDWRDANDPDHSMVGGVLAHADFPPGCGIITNTLPKPVHFDDSEHAWSIGAVNNAFDIETVALHEIGHILGLQHTSVNGAVMFPSVSDNFTLRTLQDDDLRGIRDLYPPAPLPLPLQWSLVSQTAGFGSLLDGQHPIWIADFTGVGHAQVMFYYAGDGNWWLADMVGGQLQWSLVSQTAGFGSLLDGQHPIWIADFTGVGHAQVMFYYVGDGNWWLADMVGGQLQWSLVSQTAGFGSLLDGQHPIWIADFTGVGHAQVMFYYAGDGNWWLGNI